MFSCMRVVICFLNILSSSWSLQQEVVYIPVFTLIITWSPFFMIVYDWDPWPLSLIGSSLRSSMDKRQAAYPLELIFISTYLMMSGSWFLTRRLESMLIFPLGYVLYCKCLDEKSDHCLQMYGHTALAFSWPIIGLALLRCAYVQAIFPALCIAYRLVQNDRDTVLTKEDLHEIVSDCRCRIYNEGSRWSVSLTETFLIVNRCMDFYLGYRRR